MFKRILGKFKNLNDPIRHKHLKFGVPFFVFMTMALLIIKQCGTIRYDFRKTETISQETLKELGFKVKDTPKTLEEYYEEYKKVDLDNWENVRIPRFWEEDSD